MRKTLILLLVIVLAAALTACASLSQEDLSPEDPGTGPVDDPIPGDNGNADNPDEPGEDNQPGEADTGDSDNNGGSVPDDDGAVVDDPEPIPDPTGSDPKIPVLIAGTVLRIPGQQGGNASLITVTRGEASRSAGKVALTFDAGWIYEPTPGLLDVLKNYDVKAVFFPRAKWVADNPGLAQRIIREGHLIGNHSLTHGHLIEMSEAEIRNEIREAHRIISDITGVDPYLFRPPYGEMNETLKKVLLEEGYNFSIMWTVDSKDWTEPGVNKIIDQVLNNGATNGSIILMHVGSFQTAEALPDIIAGLQTKGYQPVRLDEILPPQPASGGELRYTVQPGDTFYSLSRRFGVSIENIISYNNL